LTQAAPVRPLAIAMIEPSFGAPLVAPVGGPSLLPAGLFAARDAAVVSAITVRADEENRVAPLTKAKPSCMRQDWDWTTAVVSWQVRTSSVWLPVEWLPNTEPCRSNGRVPSISHLETRYFVSQGLQDDRTDDCAFGAMMSFVYGESSEKCVFR
jgi:hypothetical protein